jgi:hypothetical protein
MDANQIIHFGTDTPGTLPSAWVQGVTGSGTARWAVRQDESAPSKPHVLQQAGGVVWRWKDGDNYYVARANALENNVSLYYTERGRRNTLKYVDAPVPPRIWHTLRVEFSNRRITVSLNGKTYIELNDDHIGGPGAVGLWTKADSVTAFDDFSYGPAK